MSQALLRELRSTLKHAADPARALGAQRYMKSSMPYHGVSAPELRKVRREVFGRLHFDGAESWRKSVLNVFRNARFREEWYAATAERAEQARGVEECGGKIPV